MFTITFKTTASYLQQLLNQMLRIFNCRLFFDDKYLNLVTVIKICVSSSKPLLCRDM